MSEFMGGNRLEPNKSLESKDAEILVLGPLGPSYQQIPITWKDIKVITLQKIFAVDSNELIEDDVTWPYLSAMPAACNEALALLSVDDEWVTSTNE